MFPVVVMCQVIIVLVLSEIEKKRERESLTMKVRPALRCSLLNLHSYTVISIFVSIFQFLTDLPNAKILDFISLLY